LKYVKTSVDNKNKFRIIKLKIFERVSFAYNVLVFDNLFYSVGLRHMFISEILLVKGMH